ncbi:MAG: hypothetical protein NVSMB29_15350 [Candidatus Dormibacteria bacterium]
MNYVSYEDDTIELAADLVNRLTVGEAQGRSVELPPGRRERAALVEEVGRPLKARKRPLSGAEVEQVIELAGRLRSVFADAARGEVDAAAGHINGLLTDYRARPELSAHDEQPWHIHFHGDEPDGAAAGFATASGMALALVLAAGQLSRLGVCTARQCDRVYVDVSRNGCRLFCSEKCLNRSKVAALRARQAGARAEHAAV